MMSQKSSIIFVCEHGALFVSKSKWIVALVVLSAGLHGIIFL
jgi:hypothetical protein